VIAVAAAGESALMLLTMSTEQIVVLPPTLSDPLHWCTALMTSDGFTMSPVHAFKVQFRWKTTCEVPPLASIVLTIETEQVTVRGAPPGPAARLLHCENDTVAAEAGFVFDCNATAVRPSARATSENMAMNSRSRRRGGFDSRIGAVIVNVLCVRSVEGPHRGIPRHHQIGNMAVPKV